MTATHVRSRPPQRSSRGWLVLIVVALLIAAIVALVMWQRSETERRNQAAIAESAAVLDAWESEALGLLAQPPIDLAALASPTDAAGLDALAAACGNVEAHAAAVAAGEKPRIPATSVPAGYPGRAELEERRVAAENALVSYQEQVAAGAASAAEFCATYPPVVLAGQAVPAAAGAITPLLSECRISESGCIPEETDTWGQIADAIAPAFIAPNEQRAAAFAACPAPAAAGVCDLLVAQSEELIPLYTGYADALRTGDAENVEAARTALDEKLAEQQLAFENAVRSANPGVEVADPAATFSAMLASQAGAIDLAFADAETAFLRVVG